MFEVKTTITKKQNRADSMDIPQHPKPASATPLSATIQAPAKPSTPVTVAALNLEKDKIYQAIVSKLVDNKMSISSQTDTPSLTIPKTIPTSENNEWLLKLNGKLLLITSEKPLQLGQILSVKLNPSTQTLSVLPPLTPQASPIQNPQSVLSSHAAITLVLNAINQVMPRQVSLETGLTALETLSKQNDSQQVSNQAKLILLMLAKQAPTQQLFTAPEKTSTSTTTIETITNSLKNSGMFFESGTKQSPNAPNNLKLQILQIQQALNMKQNINLSQVSPSSLSAPTGTPQNTSPEPNKSNTTSKSFNAIRAALLAKIQTTLEATSQTTQQETLKVKSQAATNNFISNTGSTPSPLSTLLNSISPSLNTNNSNSESLNTHNDLKGLLLSITAALKTTNPNIKQTERPYVEALAELDLLKNPFNFPHYANQTASLASSKAEALIADQQFTTGQLLKLIAGMLNRIQFNQLNSLYQSHSNSSDSNTVQSWFFELPVANPNNQLTTFDVRIDKEEDAQKQEKDDASQEIQWKLALSFKFEQLGAIYVQVTLTPPTISSTIWADHPDTLALINREKPYFQSKLTELGLEVGDISCQKGQPKQDKTRLDQSLVDIKA